MAQAPPPANPDRIYICMACQSICHTKYEVNTTMRLPFCDLSCRFKWSRAEKAEMRRPRARREGER